MAPGMVAGRAMDAKAGTMTRRTADAGLWSWKSTAQALTPAAAIARARGEGRSHMRCRKGAMATAVSIHLRRKGEGRPKCMDFETWEGWSVQGWAAKICGSPNERRGLRENACGADTHVCGALGCGWGQVPVHGGIQVPHAGRMGPCAGVPPKGREQGYQGRLSGSRDRWDSCLQADEGGRDLDLHACGLAY